MSNGREMDVLLVASGGHSVVRFHTSLQLCWIRLTWIVVKAQLLRQLLFSVLILNWDVILYSGYSPAAPLRGKFNINTHTALRKS